MAHYRLYFTDPRGRIVDTVRLDDASEETARRRAAESVGDLGVELWCGLRQVVRFGRRVDGKVIRRGLSPSGRAAARQPRSDP